ncbi:type VI secretion system protein TssL, short form [Photorhabdus sp. APURE]|uniref:type VI secretion system protein TssL, short form n=1 Tax=Photorhabdus aballayi TaxID=2991723 RepID=UPI00223CA2AB|nr:type VI secretion system protein TssL, short form [Photorhabdus aballayi]MCW7550111.1 type VI secretion system protein TssL, short form [Photorhabdus aballayi]
MNKSPLLTEKSPPDIDALLQNSYLLVVELCQGVSVEQADVVWQHCTREIEQARQALRDADVSESAINHISYAHCALLDETVLERAPEKGYSAWRATSLQEHFFDTAEAGHQLYERMRTVLDEPAPDRAVLTCFHRVLLLGFQGKCQEDTALIREQLVTRLRQQVVPFGTAQQSPALTNVSPDRLRLGAIVGRLAAAISGMVIVLLGVWWGLGHYLATLFPGLAR